MKNSAQQNDADGGTPLDDPTESAFCQGSITWECNECQQTGATYCCQVSVNIGHGNNHALVCPQRCPWFDWADADWYRVSEPGNETTGRNRAPTDKNTIQPERLEI